jgi:putative tRNA adenosine deaminase-associated protein
MSSEDAWSVAVIVYRAEGVWASEILPDRMAEDLEGMIQVLRQQPVDNAAIGLVNVADEFFVALRARGTDVRLLLSDVTAATDWDLAWQVVERLGLDAPGEADDIVPAGDVEIFSDLGLDEMELGALLGDLDAYADEMLVSVADRLGFAEVYDRALESSAR